GRRSARHGEPTLPAGAAGARDPRPAGVRRDGLGAAARHRPGGGTGRRRPLAGRGAGRRVLDRHLAHVVVDVGRPAGTAHPACPATDGTGETQTETRRGTVPDGATGWHSRTFRVSA